MMVQIVGDGSFYFGNPSSVFAVSQQYKLPILIHRARQFRLVGGEGLDAAGLSRRRGQGGRASSRPSSLPDVDFCKVGEAFGAYGEKVIDPADVPAAIERCLKEVRGGRTAILHARVTKM